MRKTVKIEALSEFDQGTSADAVSFRTNAYPVMAWDDRGRLYVAWTERGFSIARTQRQEGDAKIVMATSLAGLVWGLPRVVSESAPGHQFMPSMTFAGGKLMLLYYDLREDVAGFSSKLPSTTRRLRWSGSGARWTSVRRWRRRGSRPCSRRRFACPITSSAGGRSGASLADPCHADRLLRRCANSCSSTRRTCRCSSSARCPSSATTSTSRRRRRSCRIGKGNGRTTRPGTRCRSSTPCGPTTATCAPSTHDRPTTPRRPTA